MYVKYIVYNKSLVGCMGMINRILISYSGDIVKENGRHNEFILGSDSFKLVFGRTSLRGFPTHYTTFILEDRCDDEDVKVAMENSYYPPILISSIIKNNNKYVVELI